MDKQSTNQQRSFASELQIDNTLAALSRGAGRRAYHDRQPQHILVLLFFLLYLFFFATLTGVADNESNGNSLFLFKPGGKPQNSVTLTTNWFIPCSIESFPGPKLPLLKPIYGT